MQYTVEEVLTIGDDLLKWQAREQLLEKVYHQNQLPLTFEALLKARNSTDQLVTEYLDATDAITEQEPEVDL
jgi:hypothetical protein